MSNSTSNVTVTKSGTGFTVDVTACNLLPDLTIKDFNVLVDGTLDSQTNWDKTSQTLLTYTGAALPASTGVEVRRATPENRVYQPTYGSVLSSTLFNEELNRVSRRAFEYAINGTGAGAVTTTVAPLNEVYGATWSTDNVRGRTANQLYAKIETLAPLASPVFTGNPTAPTQAAGDNSTKLATTAFVGQDTIDKLASSPSLGGTPTAPTPGANSDGTEIATTAFTRRSRQIVHGLETYTSRSMVPSTDYALTIFSGISLTITNLSNFMTLDSVGRVFLTPGYYRYDISFGVRMTAGSTTGNFQVFVRYFNGTSWVNTNARLLCAAELSNVRHASASMLVYVPPGGNQLLPWFNSSSVSGTMELFDLHIGAESVREL